jgi:hypothetical protein
METWIQERYQVPGWFRDSGVPPELHPVPTFTPHQVLSKDSAVSQLWAKALSLKCPHPLDRDRKEDPFAFFL